MRHILFPTDFSALSQNAFGFALDLATRMNADITTVHGYLPTSTQPEIQFPFVPEANELVKFEKYKEAAELMHRLAVKSHHRHISVNHVLEEGFPSEVIIKTSEAVNASAIVMGTRGRKGIGAVLGSVATTVVNRSNIPVFVVPEEYQGRDLEKVGMAVDLLKAIPADIEFGISFAKKLRLPLTCFHIDYNHSPKLIGTIDKFKEMFGDEVKFDVLKSHYVLDGITDYVSQNDIDLVLMETKKYPFIQNLFRISRTRQLTLHSHIPLCVLKK